MTIPQQNDTDSAIERYESFLEVDPTNVPLLISLGDLHHRAGHLEEASNYFDRALELDSEHPIARARKASVFITEHRFAEAEQLLQELGDAVTDDPALRHNLGLSEYFQEKWIDALGDFEAAAAGGVDDPSNLAYQAYCLHHLGRVEEALAKAVACFEKEPSEQNEGYLSILTMDSGDVKGASEIAENVLKVNPQNVNANIVFGTYAIERQEIDEARSYVNFSVEQDPQNPRGWLNRGLIEMYDQDFPSSVESLTTAVTYMPNNGGAWVTLGWAYIGLGDLAKAENTFRHTIEIERTFGEGHGGLAVVLALTNREVEAREEIRRARALGKKSFGAAFALSILLEASGKRDRAVKVLGKSFLQRPGPGSMTVIEAIQRYSQHQAAKQGPPPTPPPLLIDDKS